MTDFEINTKELDRQINTIVVNQARSLARRTATQARVDCPVKTGNLARSIGEGLPRIVRPRVAHSSVHATARYAAPVHEGRRGRVIVPVRAKALRFTINGRTIFASRVVQGPLEGRPFLRNAALRVAASAK